MRTISTGQDAVLRSAAFAVFQRLRVENASGTLVNLTTYGGRDWFNGGEMAANVDEIVPSARLYVARSNSTAASGSLAPLIEASTLNVGDSTSYAALLDPGREVYWDVATLAQGSTLPGNASTNWTTLFHGEIDAVDFGQPEVEIVARDKIGATLADRWVETETPYGTESGVAIETVMQEIADAWAGSQTVTTPASPGFLITTYQQQQESVLDAHRTLAQLIGWDIRPKWYNTSSAFAYVFEEPTRAPSTFAMTFGSSGYLDVKRLNISREDVRNVVVVRYTNSTTSTGTRASYTATDSTSVSRYGRRWMEIDLPDDSDINSTGEAADLGDAALSDLAYPEADQEIETFFFWPTEIGDYYRFLANGVHYDVAQDWAVYGYRHTLRNNQNRTFLQVRGTPAGQYTNWFRLGSTSRTDNQIANAKSLLNFRDYQDSTAGTVTFEWTRGDLVYEVWVHDRLRTQPESTSYWPVTGDIPDSQLAIGTDSYTATIPSSGEMRLIQFEPRTVTFEAGPVRRVRVFPRALTRVASSSDIADGVVTANALVAAAQKFGSTIVFSATDHDTVAWTSGTITFAGSTQHTIDAGNTGNMASTALRYIVFDLGASTTSLTVTTNSTETESDDQTLMAVAAKAPSTAQTAFFVPAVGVLGLNGDNLSPSSVTTNTVAANSITSAKINVAQLSAIAADLGTVTAGTVSAAVIIASSQFTASNATFSGTFEAMNGALSLTTFIGSGWSGRGMIVAANTSDGTNNYALVHDYTNDEFVIFPDNSTSAAGSYRLVGNTVVGGLTVTSTMSFGSRSAASASTAFAATHYIPMKDAAGNTFYIAGSTGAW